jgi:hypothetical protein
MAGDPRIVHIRAQHRLGREDLVIPETGTGALIVLLDQFQGFDPPDQDAMLQIDIEDQRAAAFNASQSVSPPHRNS